MKHIDLPKKEKGMKFADFKDEGDFFKLTWNEFDSKGKEIIHREIINPRQVETMANRFRSMKYIVDVV
jgi:hypothetical protein